MYRLSSAVRRLVVCGLVVAAASYTVAVAQLGPEMYGIVGRFGMGTPVPTRLLSMGGPISCVNDHQFANPAFAAVQQEASVGLRATWTAFDSGPNIASQLAHYTLPLKPNRSGLQLTVFSLDSAADPAMLPMLGPMNVSMSETALVVDYGHRLSRRLTAGLSVLGFENIDLNFTVPMGPVLIDLDDEAQWGARVGLSYEWAPGDFAGVLYSYSRDKVMAEGLAIGPPTPTNFDSSQLAIGGSRHLTPRVLMAAEFQHGVSSAPGFKGIGDTWQFGAEYLVTPDWALRAGLSDGNFCCGLGWSGPRWRLDYAFINNWNSADVALLFGGSATHSLEAIFWW
jgi:hypothetical protein